MIYNTLNVLKVIPDTIVDGPRMRTSIYLSGCFHKCPQCQNKHSWPRGCGVDISFENLIEDIKKYQHNRVTISGGDGLCYQHKELLEFLKTLKSEIPSINIWLYTGYTYEELEKDKERKEVFKYIDVLVDGKFVENLKSPEKLWAGSTNQRVIDISMSQKQNKIVLY